MFLSALLVAAALVFASPTRADEPAKITIAQTSNSMGWAADYIALDEGFFKAEGLDADIQVMSGGDPQVVTALRTGGAQFGAMTTTVGLQAIAKNEKLRMLAAFTRQYVVQIVMNPASAEKAGITAGMPIGEKLRRAKGMTVGVLDVGGGLDMLFRGFVKQEGLDVARDFTETSIHSYPGLLAAAKRGQVDIALTSIPFGLLGTQQEGLMMLSDLWNGDIPELDGAVHEGLFVGQPFVDSNPDTVRHVQAAVGRALAFIHNNPEGAVRSLHARYPNIPEATLRTLVAGGRGFPSEPIVPRAGFDLVKNFVAAYLTPDAAKLSYDDIVLPGSRQPK